VTTLTCISKESLILAFDTAQSLLVEALSNEYWCFRITTVQYGKAPIAKLTNTRIVRNGRRLALGEEVRAVRK
jgi:hypothetical protein